ncbi:MAG TPA: hypothetical protein VGM75_05075 [Pseudonocardiaceae bacterium]
MRSWRRHYGAGPWHPLGLLACFAVAAYATTRVFAQGGGQAILIWFVICVILHDGVGWPIYALADRVLTRRARPGATRGGPGVTWVNHVRVPTVISGLLLVMFAPMIFRLSNSYFEGITGFSENVYLWNWLLVNAILFGASGVLFLVRLGWARRRVRRGPPAAADAVAAQVAPAGPVGGGSAGLSAVSRESLSRRRGARASR